MNARNATVAAAGVIVALAVSPLASPGAGDDALGRPDHARLPAGHVDTLAGDVVVEAGLEGRRLVIALDRSLTGEHGDGRLDHVFIFDVERPLAEPPSQRGFATLQFWHEGLRVEYPKDRRAFDFLVGGAAPPPSVKQAAVDPTRFPDGLGMIHYSGTLIEALSLDSPAVFDLSPPMFQVDGGDGSTGVPRTCDPSACSVVCVGGSCEVECTSLGTRASCECRDGRLVCTCTACG